MRVARKPVETGLSPLGQIDGSSRRVWRRERDGDGGGEAELDLLGRGTAFGAEAGVAVQFVVGH
jgi:hypothetical protein